MHADRPSGRRVHVAIAALTLLPALAAAQAPAFRIHPPGLDELNEVLADDARALLDQAIPAALGRTGRLAPGPAPLESRCGDAPPPACVARLADDGLVLVTAARAQAGILVFTFSAVDAAARVYGPVRVGIDPMAQDAAPLVRALRDLDRRAVTGMAQERARAAAAPPVVASPAPAAAPAAPAGAPAVPPPEPAPKLAATPPKGPAPSTRATAYRSPSDARPGAWRRTTGKALTAGGAALLAGGTVLAVLGRGLSQELEDKYAQGALTPADADAYERLDLYNTAGTALLVAGGVTFASGLTLWSLAPDVAPTRGGLRLGLAGRF